jgi:hypothetical protein
MQRSPYAYRLAMIVKRHIIAITPILGLENGHKEQERHQGKAESGCLSKRALTGTKTYLVVFRFLLTGVPCKHPAAFLQPFPPRKLDPISKGFSIERCAMSSAQTCLVVRPYFGRLSLQPRPIRGSTILERGAKGTASENFASNLRLLCRPRGLHDDSVSSCSSSTNHCPITDESQVRNCKHRD